MLQLNQEKTEILILGARIQREMLYEELGVTLFSLRKTTKHNLTGGVQTFTYRYTYHIGAVTGCSPSVAAQRG